MAKKMLIVQELDGTITKVPKDKYQRVVNITRKRSDCDCMEENCPGCFLPCEQCGSKKCANICKVNRKWTGCTQRISGQIEGGIIRCKYVLDNDNDVIVIENDDFEKTNQEKLTMNTENLKLVQPESIGEKNMPNNTKNNESTTVKQNNAKHLNENELLDIGLKNNLVKSEDLNQSDDLKNTNNVEILEEIYEAQNYKIKGGIHLTFVDYEKDKFIETADDSEKIIDVDKLSSKFVVEEASTFSELDVPKNENKLLALNDSKNNDSIIVKQDNAKYLNETDNKNIEEKYDEDLKSDELMEVKDNEGENVFNAIKEKKNTEDTSRKINQSVDLKESDYESFDQTISHKQAENAEIVEFCTNNLTEDKQ